MLPVEWLFSTLHTGRSVNRPGTRPASKKGYRTPIIPAFNPDPSIECMGNDFFLATSTLEYFPGVPIYHSQDLVNWKIIGHAHNRPSQLVMRSAEGGMGV